MRISACIWRRDACLPSSSKLLLVTIDLINTCTCVVGGWVWRSEDGLVFRLVVASRCLPACLPSSSKLLLERFLDWLTDWLTSTRLVGQDFFKCHDLCTDGLERWPLPALCIITLGYFVNWPSICQCEACQQLGGKWRPVWINWRLCLCLLLLCFLQTCRNFFNVLLFFIWFCLFVNTWMLVVRRWIVEYYFLWIYQLLHHESWLVVNYNISYLLNTIVLLLY